MSRYIDSDKLIADIAREKGYTFTKPELISGLRDYPTADVKPVVRGKWVDNGISDSVLAKCSVCGIVWGSVTFDFCPGCGADMRGKQNE